MRSSGSGEAVLERADATARANMPAQPAPPQRPLTDKQREKQRKASLHRLHGSSDRQLFSMCIPAMIKLFIFAYIPMLGVVMAFQDYRPRKGIFGSEFVGFENFEFFFKSTDAARTTFNTIVMNFVFIFSGLVVSLILALIMNEMRNRVFLKSMQTLMFLPYFISWTLAGIILTTFLDMDGVITQVVYSLTGEEINFYAEPKYWRLILPLMQIWKGAGVNAIIYYANAISIDKEYYEAATMDGASRLQCAWHITLPQLKTLIIVLTVMGLGNIFRGDFGLFYFGTRNSSLLYPTTDVIDTFVYRALSQNANYSMAAAVGLFQSLVGCVLITATNLVVRKINRRAALF